MLETFESPSPLLYHFLSLWTNKHILVLKLDIFLTQAQYLDIYQATSEGYTQKGVKKKKSFENNLLSIHHFSTSLKHTPLSVCPHIYTQKQRHSCIWTHFRGQSTNMYNQSLPETDTLMKVCLFFCLFFSKSNSSIGLNALFLLELCLCRSWGCISVCG